jgi:excinuclease ABC subunit B
MPTLEAAEEAVANYSESDLKKRMTKVRKSMEKAAKDLDFMEAARFRDELKMLQNKVAEEKA